MADAGLRLPDGAGDFSILTNPFIGNPRFMARIHSRRLCLQKRKPKLLKTWCCWAGSAPGRPLS